MMKIHMINAEENVVCVAATIDADVRSWQGWMALHVEASEDISDDEYGDAALSIKAMIESYLHDVEGAAYFCDSKNIYILCKNSFRSILEQMGVQICELAFGELYLSAKYELYDLDTDGLKFAEKIFNDVGEKFSIHVSNNLSVIAEDIHTIKDKIMESKEDRNGMTKVLLVEDDAVTRWMVRSSLKEECEFVTANTANKAFALYSSFKPDIVLLDIGLPDNNGHEVLEWIMRNDPKACVVMLSSKNNVENISGCLEKGAKGFIPKPFVRENLLHYIRAHGCAAE